MARKINMFDASLFRIQAMLEVLVRMQCEVMSHLSKRPHREIVEEVWKEIDYVAKKNSEDHSSLGGDPLEN